MTEESKGAHGAGPSHRSVEIGVAATMAVFSLIVIGGSVQVGYRWSDGPQAGFFPFYIGLLILFSSLYNLIQAMADDRNRMFAEWSQLRQVLAVVIPSVLYVALIPHIGIYLASMLLIAVFMKWIGRYGWRTVIPIALLVPLVTFVVFERWFLVPLPKGPIEEMLGF